MMRKINQAVVYLGIALLSACGGGGGGGTGNSSAALLTITPSNYEGIATDSMAGANGTADTSSLGVNLIGAQISQSGSVGLKKVVLSTANTVLKNWAAFNQPSLTGAVIQETLSCTGGGTVSASVDDADDSQSLSSGDTARARFINCSEDGMTINGSLTITVNSFSGNMFSSGSANLSMSFNNLTAGSDAIDGSLNLVINQTNQSTSTVSLTMPNITFTTGGYSLTYNDMNLTASTNGSTTSLTMTGNVSSGRYGGSVDVSTPAALTIDSSNRVTGNILMTGNNGTKVRIMGQGTTSILIEADTTGNGTYNTNTLVTLASLGL